MARDLFFRRAANRFFLYLIDKAFMFANRGWCSITSFFSADRSPESSRKLVRSSRTDCNFWLEFFRNFQNVFCFQIPDFDPTTTLLAVVSAANREICWKLICPGANIKSQTNISLKTPRRSITNDWSHQKGAVKILICFHISESAFSVFMWKRSQVGWPGWWYEEWIEIFIVRWWDHNRSAAFVGVVRK